MTDACVPLAPEVRIRLLAMSAAMIDRALGDVRRQAGTATRRRTAPSAAIRRSVPVRTFDTLDGAPSAATAYQYAALPPPIAIGGGVRLVALDAGLGRGVNLVNKHFV